MPRPTNGLFVPLRVLDGDFAGWLRDAMDSRGLSARMVGLRTGINHSTITRLLGGRRDPSLRTAALLVRFFADPIVTKIIGRDAGTEDLAS